MAGDEGLDAGGHGVDLVAGGTDERRAIGQGLFECRAVQGQPVVGGEPVDEVGLAALLAHGQRDRHRVGLDRLVRHLAADPGADRGHEDLGGGEERQVSLEFLVDHRGVGPELVEHGQERLEHAVQGEERVRQRDAAHDGAEHVTLVPLRARELGGHRAVAAQHHLESVDALARAGVHLVRHGGRADLAGLEALGDQLVPGHEPDGLGERRGAGAELHERGDDLVVERARVDLTDRVEGAGEAEVRGDPALELGHLAGVSAEQVEHVLRRAHRALDAAQRVPLQQ